MVCVRKDMPPKKDKRKQPIFSSLMAGCSLPLFSHSYNVALCTLHSFSVSPRIGKWIWIGQSAAKQWSAMANLNSEVCDRLNNRCSYKPCWSNQSANRWKRSFEEANNCSFSAAKPGFWVMKSVSLWGFNATESIHREVVGPQQSSRRFTFVSEMHWSFLAKQELVLILTLKTAPRDPSDIIKTFRTFHSQLFNTLLKEYCTSGNTLNAFYSELAGRRRKKGK